MQNLSISDKKDEFKMLKEVMTNLKTSIVTAKVNAIKMNESIRSNEDLYDQLAESLNYLEKKKKILNKIDLTKE